MTSILWQREPHTAAKHQVLRAYLDGWIPVMGHQALRVRPSGQRPRLLLIDGFAGPGRYAGGEPGSPLIMIESLLTHRSFGEFAEVDFKYLFIEHDVDRARHLEQEVRNLGQLPPNVSVSIRHGEFESLFSELIEPILEKGNPPPIFAFIDPFGYSSASMSTTGRLLDFPRCETLFFLPMSFIHRFVGREGQDAALTSLSGLRDGGRRSPSREKTEPTTCWICSNRS